MHQTMTDVSFDPAIVLDSRENSGSIGRVAAIQNKVVALWQQQEMGAATEEGSSSEERYALIEKAKRKIMYRISKDSGSSFSDSRLYEYEGEL